MKYAKFISFLGNLCYQQPPLLWTYLHGEKQFLVGGLLSLPYWIFLSSLPFEEALLFCSLKLPFSTYIILKGSWQSPIFNLHVIYRILTVCLFWFTCYLQNLDSLPFSIYMLFAGSWQSPFSIYMLFTGFWQSPFFNLHIINYF